LLLGVVVDQPHLAAVTVAAVAAVQAVIAPQLALLLQLEHHTR
jgi:hypothetical protein